MDPIPDAIDDDYVFLESEADGDVDGNVTANDVLATPPLPISAVNGIEVNVGAWVDGSSGGRFRINADGTFDFDADGDFDALNAGETATTEVTYSIDFVGAASVVDVVLMQDLSGSFGDDLPNVQAQFSGLYDTLNASRDVDFGVASFVDNPFFGGAPGEYVYQTESAVNGDKATTQAALDNLVLRFGGDFPESQLDALLQLALRSDTAEVGFRAGAQRIVVLQTDATSHDAGDYFGAPPNDGDTDLEDEDYASIAQVRAALEAANITPVFSVTAGVISFYEDIVAQLGRGTVVELSSDSSNLAEAIEDAFTTVETRDTATVTVTVNGEGVPGENLPPVAEDDTASTLVATAVVIAVAGNDSDPDGTIVDYALDSGPANGTVVLNADDTFTYTPDAGFTGADSFEYIVTDDDGATDTATVTITVRPRPGGLFTPFDDTVNLSKSAVPINDNALAGDDSVVLSRFDDVLNGAGGNDTIRGRRGDDELRGSTGNDNLLGDAGDDTLNGGMQNDTLRGGAGNDILNGDNDDDVIFGGAGNDVIGGGTGRDRICFLTADGPGYDIVNGFEDGVDKILLRGASITDIEDGPLGAVVSLDNGTDFLLRGIAESQLSRSDFILQGGSVDFFP